MLKLHAGSLNQIFPRTIPVYAGCCRKAFLQYEIADLFSFHGNGDGDDSLLCAIADEIFDRMYELGVTIEKADGIHNNHCISSAAPRENATEAWGWDNSFDGDLANHEEYVKLFVSLPLELENVLFRLAKEGIALTPQGGG
jgi:hypothetical protein